MDISQLIPTGLKTAHNESPAKADADGSAQAAKVRAQDDLALSDEAVFLNQLDNGSIEWGRSFYTLPPIPHTPSEIRELISSYDESLRSRLEDILRDINVSLEQDLNIQLNADDQAQVDPSHPQAQQVQQALAEHPEMAAQLGEQQQRQRLANVLEIGGALRSADSVEARQAIEQALSRQLNNPQGYQLTIAVEMVSSTNDQGQQA